MKRAPPGTVPTRSTRAAPWSAGVVMLLLAAWAPPVTGASPRKGDVWAVVVGVGDYADPRVPATPNGPSDAEQVRDWLTTAGGVSGDHTLLLVDGGAALLDPKRPAETVAPTGRNIHVALLEWLPKHVRAGDQVVVFFAGQGALGRSGTPFLIPSDASAGALDATAIDANRVAQALRSLSAASVHCVYDTSFAGRGKKWGASPKKTVRLERLVPGRRGALWMAAKPSAVAEEAKDEPHGAFTAALLSALREAPTAGKPTAALLTKTTARRAPSLLGRPSPVLAGGRVLVRSRPELVLQSGLGLPGKPPGAAVNDHGQVTVNALLGFVADEVPRLTAKHHQGRQEPVQSSTGQDFPLALHSR